MSQDFERPGRSHPATAALAAGLALVTLLVFLPVAGNGFVHYDDPLYVTGNRQVQRGLTTEGFLWAWRAAVAGNWHPLTMLSHMADAEIWGLDAGGHHLTSLALHVANVILLFLVLRRMTGAPWRSAAVAALFAVHPLRVESVAWVAERKDVLSGSFFLLALAAWLAYTRRPSAGRYALTLLAFAAGLLSKPMLVTVPFVLLLLDVWPLARLPLAPPPPPAGERRRVLGRLLAEKVPFLLLALVAGAVTLYTQRVAMSSLAAVPLTRRVANALVSYAVYLRKTFWPVDLAVIYPLPAAIPLARAALAAALLALLTALALARRRRSPWLAVGWLWFVGMLLPVIGLVQVGRQALADRYTYLPSIGLAVALVWGGAELAARPAVRGTESAAGRRLDTARKFPRLGRALHPAEGVGRLVLAGAVTLAVASLSLAARRQVTVWKDTSTLFTHAMAVAPGNYYAAYKVGVELSRRGDRAGAERHYREALRLRPGFRLAKRKLADLARQRAKAAVRSNAPAKPARRPLARSLS